MDEKPAPQLNQQSGPERDRPGDALGMCASAHAQSPETRLVYQRDPPPEKPINEPISGFYFVTLPDAEGRPWCVSERVTDERDVAHFLLGPAFRLFAGEVDPEAVDVAVAQVKEALGYDDAWVAAHRTSSLPLHSESQPVDPKQTNEKEEQRGSEWITAAKCQAAEDEWRGELADQLRRPRPEIEESLRSRRYVLHGDPQAKLHAWAGGEWVGGWRLGDAAKMQRILDLLNGVTVDIHAVERDEQGRVRCCSAPHLTADDQEFLSVITEVEQRLSARGLEQGLWRNVLPYVRIVGDSLYISNSPDPYGEAYLTLDEIVAGIDVETVGLLTHAAAADLARRDPRRQVLKAVRGYLADIADIAEANRRIAEDERAQKQRQIAGSKMKRNPLTWEHVLATLVKDPAATTESVWESFPRVRDLETVDEGTLYRDGPGCQRGDRDPEDQEEHRRWLGEQILTEINDETGRPRRSLKMKSLKKYLTWAKQELNAAPKRRFGAR